MGFKDARAMLIEALRSGQFINDDRSDAAEKNLLSTGEVTAAFVIQLLQRCAGWEYSTSKHHFSSADCHIFTPAMGGERWYIKAFFRHGVAVFVSVHP
jgi:hypothetical protein